MSLHPQAVPNTDLYPASGNLRFPLSVLQVAKAPEGIGEPLRDLSSEVVCF